MQPRSDLVRDVSQGPLAALGIGAFSERAYRFVLRYPGGSVESLSDRTGRSPEEVRSDLAPLVSARLIRIADEGVFPELPDFALGRLLNAEARRLTDAEEALTLAKSEVATYLAEHLAGERADWRPVSIDMIPGEDLADIMQTLIANTTGEMLFLRPDQWHLPTGQRMDVAVTQAIAAGGSSRVIYPAKIIEMSSDSVRARARAGERIRVLPEVPTRLAIFGTDAVMALEFWGETTGERLLIRQPGIVSACIALFDQLWSHAVTVPGFGAELDAGSRSQLLEMLAGGAKDEQIARTLGMSLRTVRRRIANLMAELGVDSRFQAGMEAVRRGWL